MEKASHFPVGVNPWGVPPTNSGTTSRTAQEFQANRDAVRFFADIKMKAEGLKYCCDIESFTLVAEAVALLLDEVIVEKRRRDRSRTDQLELEGLLSASDRAAINQAEMRL